ncbi:MAG: bifunctional diaminohydroxyphosphoribosylaminopyrimidine deaminase/5-amino-6-(5-phosphoribosylamino)uracil reductase RibD [Pseudomonadota bacterium]
MEASYSPLNDAASTLDGMALTDADHRYMKAALRLSRRGLGQTWPNPSVGALVVTGGYTGHPVILGGGTTADAGRPHAERIALDDALTSGGAEAPAPDVLRGSTVYVTLEPCCHYGRTPPCTDALIDAGVARVVTAMADPDHRVSGRGHGLLREAGVEVKSGILQIEAEALHLGHITRVQTGKPFVTLKIALSADGFIADAHKRPVAISGQAAMAQVHLLRAEYDAILIGVGTAIADDPQLTVRLPGMASRSPTRIVLDTQLRLPLESRLAQGAGDAPLWVVTAAHDVAQINALQNRGIEIIQVDSEPDGRLSLDAVLLKLGNRGVTRLLIEGGVGISDALLKTRIPDQVVLAQSETVTIGEGVAPRLVPDLQSNGLDGAYVVGWETAWGSDKATVYRPGGSAFSSQAGIL